MIASVVAPGAVTTDEQPMVTLAASDVLTYDALGRIATRTLAGGTSTDTYSYVGTTETVARIDNDTSGVTDSIVSPAGDRLGVSDGTTLNWFLADLHGNLAASLSA